MPIRPVILALLLAGCSEYNVVSLERQDIFQQLAASEVDILLVVDNSCSMQPYQEELASNFDNFLTFFEEGDVDYHIGVLTTTLDPSGLPSYNACPQSKIDQIPQGGSLVKGEFLTPDTPDGASLFSQIVNVGICGSGTEMGLESAALSMQGNLGANFLRKDAFLSFIFVSDEEDASPWPVNDYTNLFREVKGNRNRDSFNASALVITDDTKCSKAQLNAGGVPGTRYVDVAEQNGGILGNICDDSFERVVTELSLATSRLSDIFYLSERPNTGSIVLTLEGEEVSCEEGGWSYVEVEYEGEPDVPAIQFERAMMPAPFEEIVVEYNAGSGGDFVCGGAQ